MNTLVLNSIIACLSVTTAFGQTQSDVEFLRARADAHERKISQLEQDLSRLKALLAEKPATAMADSSLPVAPVHGGVEALLSTGRPRAWLTVSPRHRRILHPLPGHGEWIR